MSRGHASTQDPRSIITPDAFEVSEALLGMPLAAPRRRFVALMIDLAVIGVVTVVTKSFALILGVVAAVFFIRAGFKRTPVKGSVFGRAMRLSVGCLGFFIAIITASLWGIFGIDFESSDQNDLTTITSGIPGGAAVFTGIASGIALASAEDLENAQDALRDLVDDGQDLDRSTAEVRELAIELMPDAAWTPDAIAYLDELLAPTGDPTTTVEATAIDELTTEEVMLRFSEFLSVDPEDDNDEDAALRAALQSRLSREIAADTLALLGEELADTERDLQRERRRHEATQAELTEATDGGILGSLMNLIDELGFGFGWASLYLTIFLSWWNGQTVGKRAMGIRVVRLDGEPITWWIAFERAGGYAAGFATGLLGFFQVYWDSNRQTIHDRIVGTAVVVDGAERVAQWEEAL